VRMPTRRAIRTWRPLRLGDCGEHTPSTPQASSLTLQHITLNLVTAFAVPRAGALHPSVATPHLSAAQPAKELPVVAPV